MTRTADRRSEPCMYVADTLKTILSRVHLCQGEREFQQQEKKIMKSKEAAFGGQSCYSVGKYCHTANLQGDHSCSNRASLKASDLQSVLFDDDIVRNSGNDLRRRKRRLASFCCAGRNECSGERSSTKKRRVLRNCCSEIFETALSGIRISLNGQGLATGINRRYGPHAKVSGGKILQGKRWYLINRRDLDPIEIDTVFSNEEDAMKLKRRLEIVDMVVDYMNMLATSADESNLFHVRRKQKDRSEYFTYEEVYRSIVVNKTPCGKTGDSLPGGIFKSSSAAPIPQVSNESSSCTFEDCEDILKLDDIDEKFLELSVSPASEEASGRGDTSFGANSNGGHHDSQKNERVRDVTDQDKEHYNAYDYTTDFRPASNEFEEKRKLESTSRPASSSVEGLRKCPRLSSILVFPATNPTSSLGKAHVGSNCSKRIISRAISVREIKKDRVSLPETHKGCSPSRRIVSHSQRAYINSDTGVAHCSPTSTTHGRNASPRRGNDYPPHCESRANSSCSSGSRNRCRNRRSRKSRNGSKESSTGEPSDLEGTLKPSFSNEMKRKRDKLCSSCRVDRKRRRCFEDRHSQDGISATDRRCTAPQNRSGARLVHDSCTTALTSGAEVDILSGLTQRSAASNRLVAVSTSAIGGITSTTLPRTSTPSSNSKLKKWSPAPIEFPRYQHSISSSASIYDNIPAVILQGCASEDPRRGRLGDTYTPAVRAVSITKQSIPFDRHYVTNDCKDCKKTSCSLDTLQPTCSLYFSPCTSSSPSSSGISQQGRNKAKKRIHEEHVSTAAVAKVFKTFPQNSSFKAKKKAELFSLLDALFLVPRPLSPLHEDSDDSSKALCPKPHGFDTVFTNKTRGQPKYLPDISCPHQVGYPVFDSCVISAKPRIGKANKSLANITSARVTSTTSEKTNKKATRWDSLNPLPRINAQIGNGERAYTRECASDRKGRLHDVTFQEPNVNNSSKWDEQSSACNFHREGDKKPPNNASEKTYTYTCDNISTPIVLRATDRVYNIGQMTLSTEHFPKRHRDSWFDIDMDYWDDPELTTATSTAPTTNYVKTTTQPSNPGRFPPEEEDEDLLSLAMKSAGLTDKNIYEFFSYDCPNESIINTEAISSDNLLKAFQDNDADAAAEMKLHAEGYHQVNQRFCHYSSELDNLLELAEAVTGPPESEAYSSLSQSWFPSYETAIGWHRIEAADDTETQMNCPLTYVHELCLQNDFVDKYNGNEAMQDNNLFTTAPCTSQIADAFDLLSSDLPDFLLSETSMDCTALDSQRPAHEAPPSTDDCQLIVERYLIHTGANSKHALHTQDHIVASDLPECSLPKKPRADESDGERFHQAVRTFTRCAAVSQESLPPSTEKETSGPTRKLLFTARLLDCIDHLSPSKRQVVCIEYRKRLRSYNDRPEDSVSQRPRKRARNPNNEAELINFEIRDESDRELHSPPSVCSQEESNHDPNLGERDMKVCVVGQSEPTMAIRSNSSTAKENSSYKLKERVSASALVEYYEHQQQAKETFSSQLSKLSPGLLKHPAHEKNFNVNRISTRFSRPLHKGNNKKVTPMRRTRSAQTNNSQHYAEAMDYNNNANWDRGEPTGPKLKNGRAQIPRKNGAPTQDDRLHLPRVNDRAFNLAQEKTKVERLYDRLRKRHQSLHQAPNKLSLMSGASLFEDKRKHESLESDVLPEIDHARNVNVAQGRKHVPPVSKFYPLPTMSNPGCSKVLNFVKRLDSRYGDQLARGNVDAKQRLNKCCKSYLSKHGVSRNVTVGHPPEMKRCSEMKQSLPLSRGTAKDSNDQNIDILATHNSKLFTSSSTTNEASRSTTGSVEAASGVANCNERTLSISTQDLKTGQPRLPTSTTDQAPTSHKRKALGCLPPPSKQKPALRSGIASSVDRLASRPISPTSRLMYKIQGFEREFGKSLSIDQRSPTASPSVSKLWSKSTFQKLRNKPIRDLQRLFTSSGVVKDINVVDADATKNPEAMAPQGEQGRPIISVAERRKDCLLPEPIHVNVGEGDSVNNSTLETRQTIMVSLSSVLTLAENRSREKPENSDSERAESRPKSVWSANSSRRELNDSELNVEIKSLEQLKRMSDQRFQLELSDLFDTAQTRDSRGTPFDGTLDSLGNRCPVTVAQPGNVPPVRPNDNDSGATASPKSGDNVYYVSLPVGFSANFPKDPESGGDVIKRRPGSRDGTKSEVTGIEQPDAGSQDEAAEDAYSTEFGHSYLDEDAVYDDNIYILEDGSTGGFSLMDSSGGQASDNDSPRPKSEPNTTAAPIDRLACGDGTLISASDSNREIFKVDSLTSIRKSIDDEFEASLHQLAEVNQEPGGEGEDNFWGMSSNFRGPGAPSFGMPRVFKKLTPIQEEEEEERSQSAAEV